MTVIQILWVWLFHRYLSHLSFPSSFQFLNCCWRKFKMFCPTLWKEMCTCIQETTISSFIFLTKQPCDFCCCFQEKNIEPPSRQGHKRVRQNMFWKHCNFFCILSPDFCGRNIAMGRLLNRREGDLSTYGICSHAIVRVWRIWWIYKHFRN